MKKHLSTHSSATPRAKGGITFFGDVYVMVIAAQLVAISIVLGKYLAINIGQHIRISFENLPLITAGILFGPFVGGAVGAVSDLIGCILVGYEINPIITLGAALVGGVSGAVAWYLLPRRGGRESVLSAMVPTFAAHTVGSVFVKTTGMMVYYGLTLEVLWVRVLTYIFISVAESGILILLLRSRGIRREINRSNADCHKKRGK